MKVKSEREVTQSCLTLSNPMDCSPPGSSVHGIFQARVLEWGANKGNETADQGEWGSHCPHNPALATIAAGKTTPPPGRPCHVHHPVPLHNLIHWVLFLKHTSPLIAKQATAALSCQTPRQMLEQLVLEELTLLDEDQDKSLISASWDCPGTPSWAHWPSVFPRKLTVKLPRNVELGGVGPSPAAPIYVPLVKLLPHCGLLLGLLPMRGWKRP